MFLISVAIGDGDAINTDDVELIGAGKTGDGDGVAARKAWHTAKSQITSCFLTQLGKHFFSTVALIPQTGECSQWPEFG